MASIADLDDMVAELRVEVPLLPESGVRSFNKFSDLKGFFQAEANFWQPTGLSQIIAAFQQVSAELTQAEQRDLAYAKHEVNQVLARSRRD